MKRLFDITIIILTIPIILPIFIVAAVLVRLKLGSPILFRQIRPGLNAIPFEMVKFRSMTDERNSEGKLLLDSARLTPFGKFLRSTSLDELPEDVLLMNEIIL